MVTRAPAKLNLCLYLGPTREDGLHELRSLFCPLALSDRIQVTSAEDGFDEVVCEGVEGPNLAADALAALRARGWRSPPLRVEIDKRIPVAAGLGGGSADAAAVLRLGQGDVSGLEEIALGLGADVPSQVHPGFGLVSGAGERMERLPAPSSFGVLLLPFTLGLSAKEVYAEADRLGLGRPLSEIESVAAELRQAAGSGGSPLGYSALLRNDLEDAALSLRPEIGDALDLLRDVGAESAFVSGSGPTAVGIFDDIVRADRAYGDLGPAWADAIVTASAAP